MNQTTKQRLDDLERKLAPNDIYKVYIIGHDPDTNAEYDLLTGKPVKRDPIAKVIRVTQAYTNE